MIAPSWQATHADASWHAAQVAPGRRASTAWWSANPGPCASPSSPRRDEIVAGSRGYWRTVLTLRGRRLLAGYRRIEAEHEAAVGASSV